MSELVDCVNCGKQVMVNHVRSDERCYWCGNPAQKKVKEKVTMVEEKTIPPRPDISGMTKGQRMKVLGDYYAANKDTIMADFEALGEEAMLQKWGISYSGWMVRRAQWFPERFEPPKWKQKSKRGEGKKRRRQAEPGPGPRIHASETNGVSGELDYLRGYRDAIQDVLRARIL